MADRIAEIIANHPVNELRFNLQQLCRGIEAESTLYLIGMRADSASDEIEAILA